MIYIAITLKLLGTNATVDRWLSASLSVQILATVCARVITYHFGGDKALDSAVHFYLGKDG